MGLPLEGVRIVEMGQLIAIPHSTKLLADMGAQLIRIESCVRLEAYRAMSFYENSAGGRYWDLCANFYEQNRNKLSLTLDLGKPQGLDTLKELIAVSDVFAENFTPRVMKNFGLEYEDLSRLKPDIIMVSSTGYGYTGPWSSFGAIAYSTEAASGLTHMTGYKAGPPVLPDMPYADYVAAEHTAFAIVAALIYRARTGKGQFIDISQAETVSSTIPEALMDYTVNGRIRERMGNQDFAMAPHGCYPCKGDEKWIAIGVAADTQWESLCDALGNPPWSNDERFEDGASRWEHRDELDSLLGDATRAWDHYELMHSLQQLDVPAGAVLNSKQLLFEPHLRARKFYETVAHHPSTGMPPLPYPGRPWKMSRTPARTRGPAPIMGEHNLHVLSEILGMPESKVESLERQGVIGYEPVGAQAPTVISLEDQMRQGKILGYDEDFKEQLQSEYHG